MITSNSEYKICIFISFSVLIIFHLISCGGRIESVYAEKYSSSPYIREFDVPLLNSGPLAIDVARDGTIWFTMEGANKLGSFNPVTKEFKLFQVPWKPDKEINHYGMEGIIADDRGFIWFTHGSTNKIGQFNPVSNSFRGYDIPTHESQPIFLILDEWGNLWFSELRGDKIGVIIENERIVEYDIPTEMSGPAGLAFDSEGKLWFTEAFSQSIGVLDPITGNINEFKPPESFIIYSPVGIIVDENDVVWFTDHGGSELIQFDPKINSWKKYSTSQAPPEIYPVSLPNDLEMDENGDLWIAEHAGNKIAKFDRSTQIMTEYTIPTFRAITLWLALAPDGKIWFAEAEGNKIGMIDPSEPVGFTLSVPKEPIIMNSDRVAYFLTNVSRIKQSNNSLEFSTYGEINTVRFRFDPEILNNSSIISNVNVTMIVPEELEEGKYVFSISIGEGSVSQTASIYLLVPPINYNVYIIILVPLIALVLIFSVLVRKSKRNRQAELNTNVSGVNKF